MMNKKDENYFAHKMSIILHESKSFSLLTVETLSSLIFGAAHAVNENADINVEKIKNDLCHKYSSITINSYINPEKRDLKLFEEKSIKKLEGINVIKSRIQNKNKLQSKILKFSDNKKEDSFELNEEGDDYYDDDFEVNEKIFYFTRHFYDGFDIIAFKNKKNQKRII